MVVNASFARRELLLHVKLLRMQNIAQITTVMDKIKKCPNPECDNGTVMIRLFRQVKREDGKTYIESESFPMDCETCGGTGKIIISMNYGPKIRQTVIYKVTIGQKKITISNQKH